MINICGTIRTIYHTAVCVAYDLWCNKQLKGRWKRADTHNRHIYTKHPISVSSRTHSRTLANKHKCTHCRDIFTSATPTETPYNWVVISLYEKKKIQTHITRAFVYPFCVRAFTQRHVRFTYINGLGFLSCICSLHMPLFCWIMTHMNDGHNCSIEIR